MPGHGQYPVSEGLVESENGELRGTNPVCLATQGPKPLGLCLTLFFRCSLYSCGLINASNVSRVASRELLLALLARFGKKNLFHFDTAERNGFSRRQALLHTTLRH